MNILFHLTAPPPAIPGTDAVFQDIEALRAHFGGNVAPLYPLRRPSRWFPKYLYGLHMRRRLLDLDGRVDLHQVSFAYFYFFPVLRVLRKQIVYVITAGLQGQPRPRARDLARIRCFVISNERDRDTLQDWGISKYRLIRPGIDTSRFSYTPPTAHRPFVLFVGSAPWIRSQFRDKGTDHILLALRELPDVRAVFLWRGHLEEEMRRRVCRLALEDRVEIINEAVDVNSVLARCHAGVALAATPRIVKAYPHSLLESLAAGKPVLVSDVIPMADYVREKECGVVVEQHTPLHFKKALTQLMVEYDRYGSNAWHIGAHDFSRDQYLRAFGELYDSIRKECR